MYKINEIKDAYALLQRKKNEADKMTPMEMAPMMDKYNQLVAKLNRYRDVIDLINVEDPQDWTNYFKNIMAKAPDITMEDFQAWGMNHPEWEDIFSKMDLLDVPGNLNDEQIAIVHHISIVIALAITDLQGNRVLQQAA